jgi:hypothetical protein
MEELDLQQYDGVDFRSRQYRMTAAVRRRAG